MRKTEANEMPATTGLLPAGRTEAAFDAEKIEIVFVDELKFDPMYQPPIREGKLRVIFRSFWPELAGLIIVSRRRNGELFVMDGQHRATVVKKKGIQTLAAYVMDGLSLQDEAEIFNILNTARKQPSAMSVFKARLVAGHTKYVEINAAIEECGFEIAFNNAKGGTKIAAIAAVMAAHSRGGKEGLMRTLTVMREAWQGDITATDGEIINGLSHFLCRGGTKIIMHDLIEKLQRVAPIVIKRDAMARSASNETVSLVAAVSERIARIYNKGRRSTRIDDSEMIPAQP